MRRLSGIPWCSHQSKVASGQCKATRHGLADWHCQSATTLATGSVSRLLRAIRHWHRLFRRRLCRRGFSGPGRPCRSASQTAVAYLRAGAEVLQQLQGRPASRRRLPAVCSRLTPVECRRGAHMPTRMKASHHCRHAVGARTLHLAWVSYEVRRQDRISCWSGVLRQ